MKCNTAVGSQRGGMKRGTGDQIFIIIQGKGRMMAGGMVLDYLYSELGPGREGEGEKERARLP